MTRIDDFERDASPLQLPREAGAGQALPNDKEIGARARSAHDFRGRAGKLAAAVA